MGNHNFNNLYIKLSPVQTSKELNPKLKRCITQQLMILEPPQLSTKYRQNTDRINRMHTSKKKRKRRSRINRTHIKESSIELESFWWGGPTELTLGSSIHYYNYISSFTKDFVSFLSYCMYILYKTRVLVCSLKCIFYLDSYFLWKM